ARQARLQVPTCVVREVDATPPRSSITILISVDSGALRPSQPGGVHGMQDTWSTGCADSPDFINATRSQRAGVGENAADRRTGQRRSVYVSKPGQGLSRRVAQGRVH